MTDQVETLQYGDMATPVTIISLNMKFIQPQNSRYPKMVEYLKNMIHKYQPDAICMQEIGSRATSKLSTDIGYPYWRWTPYGYMGISTISRHPLTTITDVRLENRNRIIPRSAQVICVHKTVTAPSKNPEQHEQSDQDSKPIIIANMHLCHQKESNRMYQLSRLHQQLQSLPDEHLPDFLIGDCNAIQPSDYTDEELMAIQSSRQKYSLEPAKGDVIRYIKEDMKFVIPPYKGPTCPYNTRVDYICPSQRIVSDQSCNLGYIVDREPLEKNYTDHCASIVRVSMLL